MPTIPGFTRARVTLSDVTLSVQEAGTGPALILLHGYPQNGMCWSRVAPAFAARFRVIVPDLRGYGESDAPPGDRENTVYSKRRMAQDIVDLMDALGLPDAMVLGHDRGARVAYRLALDHPSRLTRLGIVEVVPTAEMWRAWGAGLSMKAYHWTFLAQPAPLPERLIAADPTGYIEHTLASWTRAKSLAAFPSEALESYRVQARDPSRIHAICADYRAGATTDRMDDEADLAASRRIGVPLCFLWAVGGFPASTGDPAAIWRRWAVSVSDVSCESGHFAPEEAPEAVLAAYLPFFSAAAPELTTP